jgi:hypothetical protein
VTESAAIAVSILGPVEVAGLAEELARAEHDLVVWLAPGDELLPGAVEKLEATMAARPELALAYPAFELLDERGALLASPVPEELDFAAMMMFQFAPVGPGAIFRRDLARQALPAAARGPVAEFELWLGLAARGEASRQVETLARRRRRTAEAPADPRAAARERLDLLDRLLAAEPEATEAELRSAARSACVLAAAQFEDGFNSPEDRFHVADRFALAAPLAGHDDDAILAELEARVVELEQRASRHRAVVPLLEANVAAREHRLAFGPPPQPEPRPLRNAARRLLGGSR